jgi:peptidoglycan/xylan/chitin deacetylase (PgdA/CDA1 family)
VFNPDARSYQYYDVDPGVFLRRTYESARAHQELAFKHPEQATELGGGWQFGSSRSRWVSAGFIVAPAAFSWPLRAAVAALVRRGHDGPRVRQAFLVMRIVEHARGVHDARRTLGRGQAVVLAYHSVADLGGDPILAQFGVPPTRFAAQLDSLRRRGWSFVDLDAVLYALAGERRLPRRAVLVTFDDCYADLLAAGVPILAEREIPAIAFAVAGLLGATNQWDLKLGAQELSLLDADGLRELHANRVEIGSHGVWHRPLTKVPADELEDELVGSARRLEQVGLSRPRAFSYPYGDLSAKVAGAARDAGYSAAFTTEPGVVRRHSERTALPRIEVHASDLPWQVRILARTAGWPAPLRVRALRYLRVRP